MEPNSEIRSAEETREGEDDEALEFRLFATSQPTGEADDRTAEQRNPIQRIRIDSPTPEASVGGFVEPDRPSNYYFTSSAPSKANEEYKSAAVSAADVLALSRIPWPGTSLTWRVLHLPLSGEVKSIRSNLHSSSVFHDFVDCRPEDRCRKRTRPGKKFRIKLRVRKARENAKLVRDEERERLEREKRNKKNREKKVKRRAREREKRASAAVSGDDGEAGRDVLDED